MAELKRRPVALVTGSGKRRLGNVVAEALAQKGYDVALHFHHSENEAEETVARIRHLGVEAEAFQADVSQENEVVSLFKKVRSKFGRLDVLVTTAAIWESKPFDEVTADDVDRHWKVNALGTFMCCQAAAKIMVAQPEGGAIVTFGDWAVVRPYRHYAAYFPSKGAIPTMTRMLAVELAAKNPNVRVNCVEPGPVMPPDDLSEHEVKGSIAGTLLKRLGRPENVAQAVLFLVENDYVTGVCLPVDGGRSVAGA